MEKIREIIKALEVLKQNDTVKVLFVTQLLPVNLILYYLLVGYIYLSSRSLVDIGLIVVTSLSGIPSFLLPFSSAINNSVKNLKRYDLTIISLQIITLIFVVGLAMANYSFAPIYAILQGIFVSLFILREPVNLYLLKSTNINFDKLRNLEGILSSLRQINQTVIVITIILLENIYGLLIFSVGFALLLIFMLITLFFKLKLRYPTAESSTITSSFINQFKSLRKMNNTAKLFLVSDYIVYPIITSVSPIIFYLLGITNMFNSSYSIYLIFLSISTILATYISNILNVKTFSEYILFYRISISILTILLSLSISVFPIFMIGVFAILILENSSFIYLNSFLITFIEKEKIRLIIPLMEFIFSLVYSIAVIIISQIGSEIGILSVLRCIGILGAIIYTILFMKTRNIKLAK
ncbi:hypothetical protein EWF20_05120 [Sulfolobus sp. S-194]|uniref:hypothetical protein n=1 Tax=Sulfolobus sp. S-194 TaxID=2512240 RepID=UPI001436D98E|nr:hypothetical protein [Sulfolobus sp. S-194]QIW23598.1 hypothetical protein EWF20_05120 [Sulfolobus sp. S-194]